MRPVSPRSDRLTEPMSSVRLLRSPDRTPLLLTTNQGLEDITAEEFEEAARAASVSVAASQATPDGMTSYTYVVGEASREVVLDIARSLRSVHHILAPEYTFDLPETDPLATIRAVLSEHDVPGMAGASSFRVSTLRRGDHAFTSVDVMRAAGAGLVDRYGTDVDLEDYDLEVRVDVRGSRVRVSTQITDSALSKRQYRVFQPPAALSPNVAYALLRLPHLTGPPGVVIDPFCGSGTIPIEAARYWPDATIVGIDRSAEVVEGARRNVAAESLENRIHIRAGDALALQDQVQTPPDLVVTNPPFGKRLGSGLDLVSFYGKLLLAVHGVLQESGWFVVLVLKPGPFSGALQDVSAAGSVSFDVRHVRRVQVGGLHPRIFIMQKGS